MGTENPFSGVAVRSATRHCVVLLFTTLAVLAAVSCSSGDPKAEPTATSSRAHGGPSSPSATPIRPVGRVSTGQEEDVSLSAGEGVVVASNSGGVAAIDPQDVQVLWHSDVRGDHSATGFGSVWLTDFDGSVVRRLDVRTGEEQAEILVPGNPIGVLAHRGSVWVAAHRAGTVSRIDPSTNEVVSVIRVGPPGSGGPFELAASRGNVYVSVNNTNQLVRLDARSGKVRQRVELPEGLYACGPITPDGPVVWVTSCLESDHVARVDLRTGKVIRSGGLRLYAGPGVVRGALIWFSGRPITPETAAGFVGLDRADGTVVARLAADGALEGSVPAFGAWWVAQGDGVARFRLEDLSSGP